MNRAQLCAASAIGVVLALPGVAIAQEAAVAPAAALEQARAALAPLPGAAIADPQAAREVTLALRDLAVAIPSLEGSRRRAANDLLARPTDNPDPDRNSFKTAEAMPFCSPHFCVHYVRTTDDAPNLLDVTPADGVPDYVESIAAAAEASYAVENGPLGWPAPKPDGELGGSALTDIYLVDVGAERIFGYAAPDPVKQQRCVRRCHAYLVLDNDFSKSEFGYDDPGIPLRVTMAHEYNHILQFAIDTFQDAWLFESTATWAEDKVFPDDNDYLSYLEPFAKTPGTPITDFDGAEGIKVYGLSVFQHWLDTGPGNYGPSAVVGTWLNSEKTRPKDFAVAAMDRSIRERGGDGFATEFSEFAAATAEWRTAGNFPDAAAYPGVRREGSLARGKRPARAVIDHTAYRLFDVKPTSRSSLKLKVRARRGVSSGIALVGRDDDTATVTRKLRMLKKGGRGSVNLPNASSFERITAVVVNADATVSGFSRAERDWIYTQDNRKYRVALG